jgi:hypothetical protein
VLKMLQGRSNGRERRRKGTRRVMQNAVFSFHFFFNYYNQWIAIVFHRRQRI